MNDVKGEINIYRYYHNSTCDSLYFEAIGGVGDVDIYVSTTEPHPTQASYLISGFSHGGERVHLCSRYLPKFFM